MRIPISSQLSIATALSLIFLGVVGAQSQGTSFCDRWPHHDWVQQRQCRLVARNTESLKGARLLSLSTLEQAIANGEPREEAAEHMKILAEQPASPKEK